MSKKQKTLISGIGVVVLGLSFGILGTTLLGNVKRYEIQPEITVPEYKSDIARVLDAYERLMDQYITLTQNNMSLTRTELSVVNRKLDAMDRKLSQLSDQLDAIRKALSMETSPQPQQNPADPVSTQADN